MAAKLIQKHLIKGIQELAIVDDVVNVRIKTPFKEKSFSVVLSILNPDPVIRRSYLDFHSRVSCGPLLSLFINKPNREEFNAFVDTLKQRALEEYNAFAGISLSTQPAALAANTFEEPPEFEDSDKAQIARLRKNIDAAKVDTAIQMLERHLNLKDIKPIVSALNALKENPQNDACLIEFVKAFNGLGSAQGAVLTYAPYIGVLLSDDPFGSR